MALSSGWNDPAYGSNHRGTKPTVQRRGWLFRVRWYGPDAPEIVALGLRAGGGRGAPLTGGSYPGFWRKSHWRMSLGEG